MRQSLADMPRSPSALPGDTRWEAVVARDPAFDGRFYFSVATTGVYCRPSCPARRPKRENVRFHASAADAEAAGFRACKRCKPDQPSLFTQNAERIALACRLIEGAEEEPKLDVLARAVELSPYHFHRLFKAIVGVTPKAYAVATRNKLVRGRLAEGATVTEAIYAAGFNSGGRFYANSSDVLGMTPSEFRSGGENAEIRFAIGECSLGLILAASSDKGVCSILFGDDRNTLQDDLRKQFPRASLVEGDQGFSLLLADIIAFVETPSKGLDLPLDVRGTAFQHRVWEALRRIQAGSTASYAEIAKRIGAPGSARAVARACASNRIAVAIPCHRVVKSDGSLSGYRGGVERKRALLAREAKS